MAPLVADRMLAGRLAFDHAERAWKLTMAGGFAAMRACGEVAATLLTAFAMIDHLTARLWILVSTLVA